jgi:hypothetical protein
VGTFAGRLGTRFLVVTVVPNILLIGYVGFLIAAGAPERSPSPEQALKVVDKLTAHQIAAVIIGILVISIASHPLQIPLIQLLEGYWFGLPFGPRLANHAMRRFQREQSKALDQWCAQDGDWLAKNMADDAQFRLDWLPDEEDLLATALGNTLRKGETSAGERYGLELDVALPRLTPLMSPIVLGELNDRRNQLDAAVRLCAMSGIATAISVALLLLQGPWLFLALGAYIFCWASYRAAVAAARGFSTSLAAAVDLCHLKLFDALSLDRPADIIAERAHNKVLTDLFRNTHLDDYGKSILRYTASKESKSDANSSPESDRGSPAS